MGEWLDTAVYKRDALKAGNSFIGPAIIGNRATSVVGPGDKVTVDENEFGCEDCEIMRLGRWKH